MVKTPPTYRQILAKMLLQGKKFKVFQSPSNCDRNLLLEIKKQDILNFGEKLRSNSARSDFLKSSTGLENAKPRPENPNPDLGTKPETRVSSPNPKMGFRSQKMRETSHSVLSSYRT